jgi:hypothetical protein
MTVHTFWLVLDRDPTDSELEDLFEAGCDDAGFSTDPTTSVANFDREAESFEEAVQSATQQVESVGGLKVVRVTTEWPEAA